MPDATPVWSTCRTCGARAARVEHVHTRETGGLYRHAKRAFLGRDDKEGARDYGRSSTALKQKVFRILKRFLCVTQIIFRPVRRNFVSQ